MKKTYALTQGFIGKEITIITSKTASLAGLSGIIVNETKFTFDVRSRGKTRRVFKRTIAFSIAGQNGTITGSDIQKSPEDRIKMRISK